MLMRMASVTVWIGTRKGGKSWQRRDLGLPRASLQYMQSARRCMEA
jgi:hypothetical protein